MSNRSLKPKKMKLLVFTDSRGQHKPAGQTYPIFGERLASDEDFDVDLFLCPMKWTTTLDFLEQFPLQRLKGYDAVILYTGIVDWSPRPATSAMQDLYNNQTVSNEGNLHLNTHDYSKKIVNNKKSIFDAVFGEGSMRDYFSKPFPITYEGERTINMYSLEMARNALLPRLCEIPNLIFISSNRLVQGWNGNYHRKRPENISITHRYSDLFCEELARNAHVIDLREWTPDDIKEMTCDNMHLTKQGSDYIYHNIIKILRPQQSTSISTIIHEQFAKTFPGIQAMARVNATHKSSLLGTVNRKDYLATLVIGLRLSNNDGERLDNLAFLLDWLDFHYGDLFDVLLIEQDKQPQVDLKRLKARPYVRHEFIYNPKEYNRGWGYNVAVRHFCNTTDVVVLMDTDVLTGANFIQEVIDCHRKYDAISPYQNVYYTDQAESRHIKATRRIDTLADASKIRNPVTLAGGILIIRRSIFVALKGFEQYIGYACEDRALDVTLFNHLDPVRIRIAPEVYVHLHHDTDSGARVNFKAIYEHLVTHYGCKYDPRVGPFEFIHRNCDHAPKSRTLRFMLDRADSFGDPNLYRYTHPPTINGIVHKPRAASCIAGDSIFPPDFTSVDAYSAKEIYPAPNPDSDELAVFYNAFKGKRCFIIGNGPSLNKHDLTLLEHEYCFGVNSFFYKTRETGFRPTFYVVEDNSVMYENIQEIRRFDAPYKFFPTNYRTLHPKQPNTFFFRMNRGFYEKSSPNYAVPRFSTDASKVLYCGQSVTYINLQLAYFMGFVEVYLIGMDFNYVIPDSHQRTGDILVSDTDDPNHFHKDYFGKGKTWKDPKLDRVALNYRMAKLVYEATGRQIINASIGGSLEIFKRVDYEDLLRRNKSPRKPDSCAKPHVVAHCSDTLSSPASQRAQSFGSARASSESDRQDDHLFGDLSRLTSSANFSAANELYRHQRFSEALTVYAKLVMAGEGPTFLYKRNALSAFRRATEAGQSCDPKIAELLRDL